jgi:hypothetical protein
MTPGLRVLAAAGALLLGASGAGAQIYRWQDDRGTVHYTNTPDRLPGSSYPFEVGPRPVAPEPHGAPAPAAAAGLLPGAHAARIPYSPGEAILVTARIAGAGPLTLMLDTGADRTIVAPQALGRLGISLLNAPRAEIRGVTGLGHGGVIQVASLEVGGAKVGPLRIIAHDAALAQADGLLGRDFLEHFTVTIDARERVVTLAPR